MKVIGGCDEAGRGCVVGPLVVAGATFAESDIPKLVRMGVRDSKQLSAGRREKLFPKIMELAKLTATEYIEPPQMLAGMLNRLEIMAMANVGNAVRPDVYYVDACDADAKKFERALIKHIDNGTYVVAEHKADSTYPSVSAASIIAKVNRDRAVAKIRNEAIEMGFPDMGSGYPGDQMTVTFLRAYAKSGSGSLDHQIRKNWDTWRRIIKAI